jgi:hypothetical protein
LLNEIVTFTLSSRKTKDSGGGRKSLMIFNLPKGSFVYFILLFIRLSPFSPVSRSDNTDQALPISEPDHQDSVIDAADTIISFLGMTVDQILHDDAPRIKKSTLSQREENAVLDLILNVFVLVPIKLVL